MPRFALRRTLERGTRRAFGRFTSRNVLVGAFTVSLLSSVVFTSALLVSSNGRATRRVMVEVASRIELQAHREITRFLAAPGLINRQTLRALRAHRVTLDDSQALQRLFWDAPREGREVVSNIYFASESGAFAGLDSVPGPWPPDRWRYAMASPVTGGQLVSLDVDAHGDVAGVPRVMGAYDPRARPWYTRAAAEPAGRPVWTDVYANFDDGAATITQAMALHDADGTLIGVAGVDLFLEHLQQFLASLSLGRNGQVILVEPDGRLLAAHAGGADSGTHRRSSVLDVPERFTRAIGAHVLATRGGFDAIDVETHERVVLDGEGGYLTLSPIGREQGVSWSLAVFVPEGDYLTSVPAQLRRVLPLALLGLSLMLVAFAVFVELVSKPLLQLRSAASRIASGEFGVPIDTRCANEVGDLARAIDDMRVRLRASFEELLEQKLRAETTLGSIADGVITLTEQGRVLYMNRVAERLTGQFLADVLDRDVEKVFRARDERTGAPVTRALILRAAAERPPLGCVVSVLSATGEPRLVHCRVAPVIDELGRSHGVVVSFSDLSEEFRLKSELVHQATHDALTDLVNRGEFERRTTRAIESARRGDGVHALCYVSLDRFKIVNDSAGHDAGDELLRRTARLLDETACGGDTVGRLGGDEFGILFERCTLEEALRRVERLRRRIEAFRFLWGGRSHGVGVSAGLVEIGPGSGETVTVMRDADSACFVAKEDGRNRIHVHHADDDRLVRLRSDRSWVERIEHALERGLFSLRAQRIETSDPCGVPHRHVEILLRLADRSGETPSPAEFLPAAERYGMAARIDRWVVTSTLGWLADGGGTGALPELCSINLSGQSLGDATSLPFLVRAIGHSGVSPSRLCFEVTETATIANLASALTLIGTLRGLGCSFALDDFGSGLSSFAYLKTLPVDFLKIDGLFVRDMLDEPLDRAMVRSINEVGQTMGMRTIAEYVENVETRLALRDLGIDYVQGYGVGHPEPLDALAFPVSVPPSRASVEV